MLREHPLHNITGELWNFPPLSRGKQYKWLHPNHRMRKEMS